MRFISKIFNNFEVLLIKLSKIKFLRCVHLIVRCVHHLIVRCVHLIVRCVHLIVRCVLLIVRCVHLTLRCVNLILRSGLRCSAELSCWVELLSWAAELSMNLEKEFFASVCRLKSFQSCLRRKISNRSSFFYQRMKDCIKEPQARANYIAL